MKSSHRPSRRPQRGATLIVTMIFLIILMLVVASAIKVTNVNTRVVGNMQTQSEAFAAAQQAIEQVISYDFTKLPQASTTTVDINNSGKAGSTYNVSVAQPVCLMVKPIKQLDLDISNPDDRSCFATGSAQNSGIIGGTPSGNSLCYNSMWNVQASAVPPGSSQPAAVINQGVTLRSDPGANC
ncbi:MAG: pilus assembly protein [Burkholderiaceae bacterium]|nr:MAG: pilus assembly protein [Burkholderiaceae bacterium]